MFLKNVDFTTLKKTTIWLRMLATGKAIADRHALTMHQVEFAEALYCTDLLFTG